MSKCVSCVLRQLRPNSCSLRPQPPACCIHCPPVPPSSVAPPLQGTEYRGRVAPHDHEMVAPFCLPEYHPWAPDGEPYQIFKGAFSILRWVVDPPVGGAGIRGVGWVALCRLGRLPTCNCFKRQRST